MLKAAVPTAAQPARLHDASYKRNHHLAELESAEHLDQIEVPEFWSRVASRLRGGDMLDVQTKDRSVLVQCYVVWAERFYAKIKILARHDISKPQAEPQLVEHNDDEFKIEFREKVGWRIVRRADKQEIKAGLPSQKAAIDHLADLKKKLAA